MRHDTAKKAVFRLKVEETYEENKVNIDSWEKEYDLDTPSQLTTRISSK